MKDAFSSPLKIGDKVIYISKIGTICFLKKGVVTSITEKRIKINNELKYNDSKEVFKIEEQGD